MKRSKTTLQGNLKPPQDSLLGGFLRLAFQPFSHIDLNRSQLAGENTAVALSGTDGVASDVAGVLCAPGRVFTAEALVAVEAAGPAVVLAGRDLSGQDAWGLSLSEDGALNVFVRLVDGSLVSRVLLANAVDAAHGVALVGDLANRSVRAYVDGVLKAEIGVADCPRPIALDAVRVVVGEGVKGRIDEVRMTRAVRTPDQFARIERKGLALVIR